MMRGQAAAELSQTLYSPEAARATNIAGNANPHRGFAERGAELSQTMYSPEAVRATNIAGSGNPYRGYSEHGAPTVDSSAWEAQKELLRRQQRDQEQIRRQMYQQRSQHNEAWHPQFTSPSSATASVNNSLHTTPVASLRHQPSYGDRHVAEAPVGAVTASATMELSSRRYTAPVPIAVPVVVEVSDKTQSVKSLASWSSEQNAQSQLNRRSERPGRSAESEIIRRVTPAIAVKPGVPASAVSSSNSTACSGDSRAFSATSCSGESAELFPIQTKVPAVTAQAPVVARSVSDQRPPSPPRPAPGVAAAAPAAPSQMCHRSVPNIHTLDRPPSPPRPVGDTCIISSRAAGTDTSKDLHVENEVRDILPSLEWPVLVTQDAATKAAAPSLVAPRLEIHKDENGECMMVTDWSNNAVLRKDIAKSAQPEVPDDRVLPNEAKLARPMVLQPAPVVGLETKPAAPSASSPAKLQTSTKDFEDTGGSPGDEDHASISKQHTVSASRPSHVTPAVMARTRGKLDTVEAAIVTKPTSVRVHLGILEFDGGGSASISSLFDTVAFRISMQFGGDRPMAAVIAGGHPSVFRPKWDKYGPATQPQPLKYSRAVSDDGTYTAHFSCDIDEAIDLPWPAPSAENAKTIHVSADVWLERRSAIEKFDSMLSLIGLGNDLPEYDRIWLGRVLVCLPPVGQDCTQYRWPVEVEGAASNEAVPKLLSIGIEWISDAPDED